MTIASSNEDIVVHFLVSLFNNICFLFFPTKCPHLANFQLRTHTDTDVWFKVSFPFCYCQDKFSVLRLYPVSTLSSYFRLDPIFKWNFTTTTEKKKKKKEYQRRKIKTFRSKLNQTFGRLYCTAPVDCARVRCERGAKVVSVPRWFFFFFFSIPRFSNANTQTHV